jgi:exodeoxyribonuclease VII large subunit
MTDIDVLVLIRGGGSWESLQAFNSEVLAKAIFASKIPVICGIGHEKDVTIASLVADFRASTPTDAAKFLSENWNLALVNIPKYEKSLYVLLRNRFKNVKEKLIFFRGNISNSLQTLIKERRAENNELFKELQDYKNLWFKKLYDLLRQQQERLNPSNPDLKLKQGYSITFDNLEQIIKDPKKVKVGQLIKTKFYKGHVFSQIKKK